jgi:hypothetical protein
MFTSCYQPNGIHILMNVMIVDSTTPIDLILKVASSHIVITMVAAQAKEGPYYHD